MVCNVRIACWSALLTGTKRISGGCAACQIALALALCDEESHSAAYGGFSLWIRVLHAEPNFWNSLRSLASKRQASRNAAGPP